MVANSRETVTVGLWGGTANTPTLTLFETASVGTTAADNYAKHVTGSDGNTEFSIAYGHYAGSGSADTTIKKQTQAIFVQYRNLLTDDARTASTFSKLAFYDTGSSEDAYFLSISRNRLVDGFDPGNWELHLSGSGIAFLKLIDDSTSAEGTTTTAAGRRYNIVSGTINDGIGTAASTKTYGYVYPDLGVFAFDSYRIESESIVAANPAADAVDNFHEALLAGAHFKARSEETVTSTYFYVRLKNKEYNFSNNPSFTSGSDWDMTNSDFYTNPKTYLTAIGLYDSLNQCLAIAKLSKPIQKSFDREALFRIKLEY